MIKRVGLSAFFFLPIIESFNRDAGFFLLILLSIILAVTLCRKNLHLDAISLLFLGVIGIFVVTLPFSISIIASAKELVRYMSYFIIFQYVREEVAAKNFSIPLLFSIIVFDTLLLTFLWGVYSLPIFHLEAPANTMNLFYPTFGHNRIALLYLFSLPISLVLSFSSKTRVLRLFFFILTLATLSLLLFTNARGVMVSFGVSVFVTVLLLHRNQFQLAITTYVKNLSKWGIFLILSAILFLSSSFLFSNVVIPYDQSALGYHYWKGFYKPITNEYRMEYLRQAWEGFARNPVIGSGLNTFRYTSLIFQSEPERWSWYAHNHYAELFSETGILGGGAFLLLVLVVLQRLIMLFRSKDISAWDVAMVIPLFGLLIHSFMDYDFHYLSVFLLFWVYAAVLLPYKERGKTVLSSLSRVPVFLTLMIVIGILSFIIIQDAVIDRGIIALDKSQQYVYTLPLLRFQHLLDRADRETTEKIGDAFVSLGRANEAHLWFARSIVLQPYYSQRAIIKDAQIYVEESEKSADTMEELQKLYPAVWRQISSGDPTQLLQNLTQVDLTRDEIKEIVVLVEKAHPAARLFQ